MIKQPVRIIMESSKIHTGIMHLPDKDRLQDVMNDDRDFLPIYVMYIEGQSAKLLLLQKRLIESIEEI